MVVIKNGDAICDSRTDVEGKKWHEVNLPNWGKDTFDVTDTLLCTADSSVWIADINGYWKEL